MPFALAPLRLVRRGASGPGLITALGQTGRLQLAFGVLLTLGLAIRLLSRSARGSSGNTGAENGGHLGRIGGAPNLGRVLVGLLHRGRQRRVGLVGAASSASATCAEAAPAAATAPAFSGASSAPAGPVTAAPPAGD